MSESSPLPPESATKPEYFICCFNLVKDGHSPDCARAALPRGEAATPTDTELDEETERLINTFGAAEYWSGRGLDYHTRPSDAHAALRQRIRELVREAGTMKAIPGKLPEPEWDY